jgi:hypothetical protein
MDQHFYNGFTKRAQDFGLSVVEADRLVKTAMDPFFFQKVVMPVTSVALGGGLMLAANSGIKANSKEDRVNQAELTQWAKKYLNSNKVDVRPRPGINNAYYQKVNDTHVIRYDPRVHKTIGAHEIGHGMSSFPRIPGSSFLGPVLAGMGAFRTGYTGGEEGLAPLLIGAGIQVPTLIDEWMASSNAKKILKDNNIKPRGLKRAWLTYAAPLLTAGIGLTGGALLRNT